MLLIGIQITSQIVTVFTSFILRDIFDAAISGNSALLVARTPIFIIFVLSILPFNTLLPYIRVMFVKKAGTVIKQHYLRGLFDKNINEFQSSGIARYVNDITNNANTLEERHFHQVTIVVMGVTQFLGSLVIIISIDWRALILVIPFIAALTFILYRTGSYLIEKRGTWLQSLNQLISSASVGTIFQKMEEHLENHQIQKINKPYPGLNRQIKLSEISFEYPDIPVLKEANARFHKNGKYLIVSPSGSGKSTILRLLRKYFRPVQGEILIDSTNLDEIETDSYYQKLANVEQNVFIFDDTICNIYKLKILGKFNFQVH